MSRRVLASWSIEALVASLSLALLLGLHWPANDNAGSADNDNAKGGRRGPMP